MKILRGLGYVFVALLFAVLIFALIDSARPAAYKKRAASVHVGDSKAQVTAALGKPTSSWRVSSPNFLFPAPERWMYGSTCDWRHWRHPFSSEFFSIVHFSPWDDDVVIDFDNSGIVQSVEIPEK